VGRLLFQNGLHHFVSGIGRDTPLDKQAEDPLGEHLRRGNIGKGHRFLCTASQHMLGDPYGIHDTDLLSVVGKQRIGKPYRRRQRSQGNSDSALGRSGWMRRFCVQGNHLPAKKIKSIIRADGKMKIQKTGKKDRFLASNLKKGWKKGEI